MVFFSDYLIFGVLVLVVLLLLFFFNGARQDQIINSDRLVIPLKEGVAKEELLIWKKSVDNQIIEGCEWFIIDIPSFANTNKSTNFKYFNDNEYPLVSKIVIEEERVIIYFL